MKWPLILVVALCVLWVGNPANSAQEAPPEEQLEQLNAAIASIESWLNSASNNRSTLENELRITTQQIESTNLDITRNRTAITALEEQRNTLSARRDALEEEKSVQQDLIQQALRASYISGQESYLKLLLNQEDPSLSARMLRYFSDFNQERMERIALFRETLSELASTSKQLDSNAQELTTRQSALEAQRASLNDDSQHREELLNALKDDIAARSGELQQLSEDREHLESLIEQIQEAIASIPAPDQITPFAQAKGNLPWPVAGAPLNRFGAAYSDGNLHRQGIVLSAEQGSAVRAVHPGRVVFADWLRGSGLLVVVDHGDGYLSLYAQNQSLVKGKGDWVNRGEALATAGANGGTGQAGVYFEIRHNGQALDPAQWCES
ncbi:MAG: murein hydrolase activator EnvC family protein [Gammaproteobacteria bacterium]